jgi:hypothetical protein
MYAFQNCQSLTSITIPDALTEIGRGAFSGCRSLTSITIPNSVTTMGKGALAYCYGLTSLIIGDGATYEIQAEEFRRRQELTTVVLGDGITTIGWRAFSDNDMLNSVTLGRNVTDIGDDAFSWAGTISKFTILNPTPPPINYTVFWETTITTLYVPARSVELYKKSDWKTYSRNIVGI